MYSYSTILKLKIKLINVNVLSSFWGWGGEDDDLYYRVRNRKLNITKLSPNLGRFKVGSTDCTWEILTLMPVYHCHKPVFRPKMAIFLRVRMREGGLPLPLTIQYLIFMILRTCDLNFVMIFSLASKLQVFKDGMTIFQLFYEMKLKTSKFKVLAFWSQQRYYNQI